MKRSSKWVGLTTVCMLTTVILAGCGAGNDTKQGGTATASAQPTAQATAAVTPKERTLKDAMGHEVKIPAQPKNVIAPFLEDSLTAIGVKPAAQWSAAGEPQQYLQNVLKGVPILDMTGGLKPEQALSHNPDLIILVSPNYMKNGTYEEFSKVAPTYVLSNDENDWRGSLTKLGEVLGKTSEAEQALKKYDQQLSESKDKIRAVVGDKSAVLFQSANEKGFKLFGANFYSGKLLYQGIGFKQPKLLKGDYETYSLEALAQLDDVDYIFVLSGKGRAKPPVDNPLWQQLPAVKQGHAYEVDSGHWFNQNAIANKLVIDDVLKALVK
ncbi:ferrichrome ABC transporter substrate-binding protein [Paenibacillus marchantiophytorum]|uniref:Ferrichrome ABC transporter substrate-binding protein n=1 Tax=Paenibacillus marchantiophytorum TaxID=1619310 RepID=A0ABQ1F724_9BACL|nr:ABC transporter substrate-binding protein [Paenibacillus marchantiophytorum]GGA01455.1 ferrichrome ABC transporter substrate-binding protein [Paenibacillus marchantiophytorum]